MSCKGATGSKIELCEATKMMDVDGAEGRRRILCVAVCRIEKQFRRVRKLLLNVTVTADQRDGENGGWWDTRGCGRSR
jgi:hypothetical protein